MNVTLAFRFDRFLDPATVSRQAIRVYTGDPNASPGAPPFEVTYDPIERVVEYRTPAGYALAPSTLYELELLVPASADDPGIRAFDGAPLAEGDVPLHGVFYTGEAPVPVAPGVTASCNDIVKGEQAVFRACLGGACHQKGGNMGEIGDATQALWLDTPSHFELSAVGRVAHETETGDQSGGAAAERSPRFGVRMALVDPRNPGGSYLMYKLLRNLDNFEPCPAGSSSAPCAEAADPHESLHPLVPLPEGAVLTPPLDELVRLQEWFVRGDPMPRPRADGQPLSIHLQGLRAVSRFIADGADCRE